MTGIFKEIDDSFIVLTNPLKVDTTRKAFNPAMFIFVGKRTEEKRSLVKSYLKNKISNSSSIIYAAIGSDSEKFNLKLFSGTDEPRNKIYDRLGNDTDFLREFNEGVDRFADAIMTASGYKSMQKGHVFIFTYADEPLNVLLPELSILLNEKCHMSIKTHLFVNFDDKSQNYIESAAFFKEIEACQEDNFSFSKQLLLNNDEKFTVEYSGKVFSEVFFLELFRSDMKYSKGNSDENFILAAMYMLLINAEKPVRIPPGKFFTAGYSIAKKPTSIIAHIMFKAMIDNITGMVKSDAGNNFVLDVFSNEAITSECENAMLSAPDINEIISVVPANYSDPDTVLNTNVRNILEYFGGKDEEYFRKTIVAYCDNCVKTVERFNVENIIENAINNRNLTPREVMDNLSYEGLIQKKLNELLVQFNEEEEQLKQDLNTILNQQCTLHKSIFSRPTGCEIIAEAVQLKYGKMFEIEKCRLKKKIINQAMSDIKRIYNRLHESFVAVEGLTDELHEGVLSEIYAAEYTIADEKVFREFYTEIMKNAISEYNANKSTGDKAYTENYYKLFTNCAQGGHEGFLKMATELFAALTPQPSISRIFAMPFDEEIYVRYKNSSMARDKGWVNDKLLEKLMDESCANLRYNTFASSKCLYGMGNEEIEFVDKFINRESHECETIHIHDDQSDSYEQLTIYGGVVPSSVTHIATCAKMFEESGDSSKNDLCISR